MQNKLLARALATMMAATTAVTTASVPMIVAPIVAMAATPTATITVKNVEEGATVTAYQLVKGVYDTAGKLTKYEVTELASSAQFSGHAVSVNDLMKYDSDSTKSGTTQTDTTANLAAWTAEVAKKVASTTAADKTLSASNDDKTTYSVAAEPGLYLVLITKADTTSTYNPILLAVNVSDADAVSTSISGSDVDLATAKFQNGTTTAYAKKTTNGLTKKIVKADNTTVDAVTAAVGDNISFKLSDMKVPSYSAQYSNPTYVITDALDTGCFDGITDLVVKVGDTEYKIADGNYSSVFTITEDGTATFTAGTSTAYKISFTSTFLANSDNAGKDVVITYKAKVSGKATQNFAENANHAQVEYNYFDTTLAQKTKVDMYDNVWVYTFGIDGSIDSEAATSTTDYTLNKVTQTGGTYTDGKSQYALADAEFTLYTDEKCETVATYNEKTEDNTAVKSDASGHISFTGLGEGTYYLKETKAPSGYTVNSTVYKIVIAATFNTTDPGKLDKYTITTTWTENGQEKSATTTVTATNATITDSTGNIEYKLTYNPTTVEILNTTLQQLPFTGGEGRYAIYIGSVALAALVVILLIVKRRRDEQEQ